MSTASAPASTANLGPGFDCLALALELRCTVTAARSDRWSIMSAGGGVLPPADAEFLRGAARLLGPCPDLCLTVDSAIPRARGLGSSAAVCAATAAAAARAAGRQVDDHALFNAVAAVEGHREQAAAAVFGGAVAVIGRKVLPLQVAPGVEVLVGIPDEELATPKARRALPDSVSHAAAARNLARVVFLVEGLRRGDRDLLAAAGGDELHEPSRVALAPVAGRLLRLAQDAGAWHAALSGSGPAVVAFGGTADLAAVRAAWEGQARMLAPAVAARGLI